MRTSALQVSDHSQDAVNKAMYGIRIAARPFCSVALAIQIQAPAVIYMIQAVCLHAQILSVTVSSTP